MHPLVELLCLLDRADDVSRPSASLGTGISLEWFKR